MPYPHYTMYSRADSDAMYAYLQSLADPERTAQARDSVSVQPALRDDRLERALHAKG
jgi:hypothetical protein